MSEFLFRLNMAPVQVDPAERRELMRQRLLFRAALLATVRKGWR